MDFVVVERKEGVSVKRFVSQDSIELKLMTHTFSIWFLLLIEFYEI